MARFDSPGDRNLRADFGASARRAAQSNSISSFTAAFFCRPSKIGRVFLHGNLSDQNRGSAVAWIAMIASRPDH